MYQSMSSYSQMGLKSSTVIRILSISVEIGICTFKSHFRIHFSPEFYFLGLIVKPIQFHVDLYTVVDVSEHAFIQQDGFEIPPPYTKIIIFLTSQI